MRRDEILNSELTFPNQIIKLLKVEDDNEKVELIYEFWNHIWHNFLLEKPVASTVWFEKFNNKMLFNKLLMHLSKAGWITSEFSNNYAYIELNESKLIKWITKEEIQNLRFKHKLAKYRLKHSKSVYTDLVKINDHYEQTGLIRNGFMKAGNNVFRYDTEVMSKYINEIAINLKKGLSGTNKDISYQEIIDELVSYYAVDKYQEYTLGNNIIDSRGRAIFQCSKKLFNPVSSKEARALLIMEPQELTSEGYKVVFAAIAELLGYRGKNIEDKIHYGEMAYIRRDMPSLKEMEISKCYDDLHVRIWLERIYKNLEEYEETKQWYVPIEVD